MAEAAELDVLLKTEQTFPPPEDFYGQEQGEYGDPLYSRTLTDDEIDSVETPERIETEARYAVDRDTAIREVRAVIRAGCEHQFLGLSF